MASFNGCNFKLTKPIFARTSDGLSINTNLSFDAGNEKDVILNNYNIISIFSCYVNICRRKRL